MKLIKLIGNKSWLGILNIIIIQWFCMRVEAEVDDLTNRNITKFNLIGFIVPVTGWRNTGEYVFIWKEWRINLWSR